MHSVIKIFLVSLTLACVGCSSIEKQVNHVVDMAGRVGNVEYRRTGFWTDSDFRIYVMPDGTRKVHYNGRSKVPGGPQIEITVEGVRQEN